MQNVNEGPGTPTEEEVDGPNTRLLGSRIESMVKERFKGRYKVFYDHKLINRDRMTARLDSDGARDDMAHPDVAIVLEDGNTRRLVLLAEIEEHKHSPKRLLGDLAAIAMSDNVEVGGMKYPLSNLTIVLGLIIRPGSKVAAKAETYVSRFERTVGEGKSGRRGIRFEVLCGESGELMAKRAEERFGELLSENSPGS